MSSPAGVVAIPTCAIRIARGPSRSQCPPRASTRPVWPCLSLAVNGIVGRAGLRSASSMRNGTLRRPCSAEPCDFHVLELGRRMEERASERAGEMELALMLLTQLSNRQ